MGSMWLVAFVLTLGVWFEPLEELMGLNEALVIQPAIAWLILALTLWPRARAMRPESTAVFGAAATVVLAGVATMGTFAFYGDHETFLQPALLGIGLCLPSAGFILLTLRKEGPAYRFWAWTTCAVLALQYLPWMVRSVEVHLIGMALFIAFWALVTRAAWETQNHGLFRFATFMVAARVVGIYFELFGSLMDTALLLISGGIITLMVARYWHRKSQALFSKPAEGEAS